LIAWGIRPNFLLIEVLPPLLNGQTQKPWEALWMDYSHLRVAELLFLKRYGVPSDCLRRQWWETIPVPWYAHRLNLVSLVAPGWLPWESRQDSYLSVDDWGDSPFHMVVDTPEKARRVLNRARREYTPLLRDFKLGGRSCTVLEEILSICRREGIHSYLVAMPEGSQFRQWYPPRTWPQIHSYLRELSRRYGCAVINARQWIADEDFNDSHHLRPEGARRFTERLADELLPQLNQVNQVMAPARGVQARAMSTSYRREYP
jgi:hypothetical protein